MSIKSEGAALTYDTAQQGATSRYTQITYATGLMITMEQLQDNQYEQLSFRRTSKLAKSVHETEEILGSQVFNRAFDSNYVGGDGVEMI